MMVEHRAVIATASELRISDSLARNVIAAYLKHYDQIHDVTARAPLGLVAKSIIEPTRRRWWQIRKIQK